MDEYNDDPQTGAEASSVTDENNTTSEEDKKLVEKLQKEVRADKKFFAPAFKRMRTNMFIAAHGRDPSWHADNYKANVTGRHIRSKVSSLYAKNPKATARMQERLDFTVWDESQESLLLAYQTVEMVNQQMQIAQAEAAAAPPMMEQDPQTGEVYAVPQQAPDLTQSPEYQTAMAVIQDYQQGTERRKFLKGFGRTLELLYGHAMRSQTPIDFKTAMKQVVRRTATTCVGFVEVGFQRDYGPRPGMTEKLADHQARIAHLENMVAEVQEGDGGDLDAEIAELQAAISALQSEGEIIVRSGLIFDYPTSTSIIPDRLTKSLVGFVGARRVTREYMYTPAQVKDVFGVDVAKQFTPYKADKSTFMSPDNNEGEGEYNDADSMGADGKRALTEEMVCVWKIYDKETGVVYHTADGYCGWLRDPEAPDVKVDDFWPIYAHLFNEVESETQIYPPSDVEIMLDQQKEINRSRQGKREHREAARPRWVYPNGALDETDQNSLQRAKAFDTIGLNIDTATKISDILQAVPIPGVDPNLYDTNEVWSDLQATVGTQQATLGGISKATATESAIAASSSSSTDGSGIDDLDSFLSRVSRAASQVMMREMTVEQVTKIVGPGAVWPEQTSMEIAEDVYLDIEAGSSGKPNQAVEINNWERMLPYLIQLGNINGEWLAKETLRRLDDKMDFGEAVAAGLPSILAQNRMAQAMPPGDPAKDPSQQGGEGGDNASKNPKGPSGSDAEFGSNQV